jgi:hypothetical protein
VLVADAALAATELGQRAHPTQFIELALHRLSPPGVFSESAVMLLARRAPR